MGHHLVIWQCFQTQSALHVTQDFFWEDLPRELVKPMALGVDIIPRVQVGIKFHFQYRLRGNSLQYLLNNRSKQLFSAIDCGHLPTPRNGTVHGEQTTYPNILRFKCDEGFTLLGSITRKCRTNGAWSGVDAICQGTNIVLCYSKYLRYVVISSI